MFFSVNLLKSNAPNVLVSFNYLFKWLFFGGGGGVFIKVFKGERNSNSPMICSWRKGGREEREIRVYSQI